MKKIIVIPAIAALAIVGLAACTAPADTQSESKGKPPVAASSSPVDGLEGFQWDIIEEVGAEYGLSSSETEAVAQDVVDSFESDLDTVCDSYYVLGDAETQEALIESAYAVYPYDEEDVAALAAYAVLVNNC